jgi:hypothetical protein
VTVEVVPPGGLGPPPAVSPCAASQRTARIATTSTAVAPTGELDDRVHQGLGVCEVRGMADTVDSARCDSGLIGDGERRMAQPRRARVTGP